MPLKIETIQKLLLKNIRVVDPQAKMDKKGDILIEKGEIKGKANSSFYGF